MWRPISTSTLEGTNFSMEEFAVGERAVSIIPSPARTVLLFFFWSIVVCFITGLSVTTSVRVPRIWWITWFLISHITNVNIFPSLPFIGLIIWFMNSFNVTVQIIHVCTFETTIITRIPADVRVFMLFVILQFSGWWIRGIAFVTRKFTFLMHLFLV